MRDESAELYSSSWGLRWQHPSARPRLCTAAFCQLLVHHLCFCCHGSGGVCCQRSTETGLGPASKRVHAATALEAPCPHTWNAGVHTSHFFLGASVHQQPAQLQPLQCHQHCVCSSPVIWCQVSQRVDAATGRGVLPHGHTEGSLRVALPVLQACRAPGWMRKIDRTPPQTA